MSDSPFQRRCSDHRTLVCATLPARRRSSFHRLLTPRKHDGCAGLHQAGIAETAAQAFEAVPVKAQAPLIGTVLLAGGNVAMPGFHDRM